MNPTVIVARFYTVLYVAIMLMDVGLMVFGHATPWLCVPCIAIEGSILWILRRRFRRILAREALPSVRTPAFPGGHGCPADSCPICGMHDPERLVDGAHESCAEWLGYVPRPSAFGVTLAEAHAGLTAAFAAPRVPVTTPDCQHDRTHAVERWGAPTMRICLDCGRDAAPQPPPGPGTATKAR